LNESPLSLYLSHASEYARRKNSIFPVIERALAEEEVIIAKNGYPLLTLQPLKSTQIQSKPGLLDGKGKIRDDLDESLEKCFLA